MNKYDEQTYYELCCNIERCLIKIILPKKIKTASYSYLLYFSENNIIDYNEHVLDFYHFLMKVFK